MSTVHSFYSFHPRDQIIPYHALREQSECYNESKESQYSRTKPDPKVLERIRSLRLMDDEFMTKVFEDKDCAQLLLRIILERNDLTVLQVVVQRGIKNLQGRSIRLDIYAEDTEGRMYNVEVQRDDKGAGFKRARYNSSLIDADITDPGDRYEDLAETYVIFITENDVFGEGLPIYHIDRFVRETGKIFDDKSHIIYVNSQIQDETALGRLMSDFWCTEAKDMHYHVLADRVHHFKNNEEGIHNMSRILEEMCDEAVTAAVKAQAVRTARMMLTDSRFSQEDIAAFTCLTLDEVRELAEKQPA